MPAFFAKASRLVVQNNGHQTNRALESQIFRINLSSWTLFTFKRDLPEEHSFIQTKYIDFIGFSVKNNRKLQCF
jgi:hypothetical protein